MARVLARTVWVPRKGSPLKERHLAGTTPPPDVAARITNPRAWKEEPAPEPGSEPEQEEDGVLPPRHGPGSGREAWAFTATARGLTVTDDMSRDDIIAALNGHDGTDG